MIFCSYVECFFFFLTYHWFPLLYFTILYFAILPHPPIIFCRILFRTFISYRIYSIFMQDFFSEIFLVFHVCLQCIEGTLRHGAGKWYNIKIACECSMLFSSLLVAHLHINGFHFVFQRTIPKYFTYRAKFEVSISDSTYVCHFIVVIF